METAKFKINVLIIWTFLLKVIGTHQDVLAVVAVIYGGYLIKNVQDSMWRVFAYIACLIYIAIRQRLIAIKPVDVDVNIGRGDNPSA